MRPDEVTLIFDVPFGRLSLSERDLEVWAEHVAWCYRLMGVPRGVVMAVQDFGNSALSFLGSSLLMPGLKQGVAERLGGRFICLDASSERVTLTPAMLEQLNVDVLVARAEVYGLLVSELARKNADLPGRGIRMIVALSDRDPVPPRNAIKPWRYLLHIESSMLIAPECPACGCFHLRAGFYGIEDGAIWNLQLAGVQPCRLRGAEFMPARHCDVAPDDCCVRIVRGM